MHDVVVLMSTYNGDRYIREQIDSIMNQSYKGSIRILIRDDGSKDKTIETIESYVNYSNREIRIIKGENIGPQRSFLELIKASDNAGYYFFADQDDIWYPDKISRAVQAMKEKNDPVCYCSNYDIYNSELDKKKSHVLQEKPVFKPIKIILYNQIPGCVIGFNKRLMQFLKEMHVDNVMMHDSMVLSFASASGTVIYDDVSTISHRIHGKNVVGEGHKKIVPHKWIVDKVSLVVNKDDYDISVMADEFLKTGQIKEEHYSDLQLLRDYKKSWGNTFKLLKHPDSHDVFMDRTTMSIRCKIFFHVF